MKFNFTAFWHGVLARLDIASRKGKRDFLILVYHRGAADNRETLHVLSLDPSIIVRVAARARGLVKISFHNISLEVFVEPDLCQFLKRRVIIFAFRLGRVVTSDASCSGDLFQTLVNSNQFAIVVVIGMAPIIQTQLRTCRYRKPCRLALVSLANEVICMWAHI